ncbi:MAG: peptide deformylase, partial [Bacteroidia bacterium]
NFKEYIEVFNGLKARIIQHEYDHIEGILFTEHLSAFKKSLIKGKLNNIAKGDFERNYPVKIYHTNKRRK